MKKVIFAFLFSAITYGQSTIMLAMVLEEGKEDAYLKMEKIWQTVNELAVENYSQDFLIILLAFTALVMFVINPIYSWINR